MNWLKALYDRVRIVRTTLSLWGGYGSAVRVPKPFEYRTALDYFTGWVYSAASLNAKGCAAVPLKMYVRRRKGVAPLVQSRRINRSVRKYLAGDMARKPSMSVIRKAVEWGDDWEEVTTPHPAMKLLSESNRYITGYEATLLRFMFLELTGNAYIAVVDHKLAGIPFELWLLPPQHVDIVPGDATSGTPVVGYNYGYTSEKLFLEKDSVLHFRQPNPRNPYYGLGKIEAGWDILQQNAAQHVLMNAMYENGARPDYAVIVKAGAGQAEIERFEASWKRQFQDVRDSGRAVTITGDTQIVPLAWPPANLGPLDKILEEICAVFGVPRDKMLGQATYANAEQADIGWLRDTIAPLLRLDEEVLNNYYLPKWGIEEDAFLAYDDPVPEAADSEHKRRVENVNAGILTVNEAREDLGLQPIEGGDEARPAQPAFSIGGLGGGGFTFGSPAAGAPAFTFSGRRPTSQKAMLYGDVRCHCHKAGAADNAREAESERRVLALKADVTALWKRQADAVLSKIKAGKAKPDPQYMQTTMTDVVSVLFDVDWESELDRILREHLADVLKAGAEAGIASIGQAFDLPDTWAIEFAAKYTPRLARTLTADRARQIQDIVHDALVDGSSGNELAWRMQESPAFSEDGIANRAEMIARTESARAHIEGQVTAWEESGVVDGKQWLLAPDACEFCKAAAAEFAGKTVALRDAFYLRGSTLVGSDGGTMKLDYSDVHGPPLHPFDRCDVVPVVKTE